MAKNTYGTGCFLLMNTGSAPVASRHRLLGTVGWGLQSANTAGTALTYALEGSVFVAGAAIQWLRDKLGIIATSAESEALARSVPDTKGVHLVPAFTGLGAPHWDPDARGAILGLTRDAYLMTGVENMWINVGRGQFHLPTRGTQVVRGITGLVLPSLDALRQRLRMVEDRLAGTKFAWTDHEIGRAHV